MNLMDLQWQHSYTFLTMDVSSLYINIVHDISIKCIDIYETGYLAIPLTKRTHISDLRMIFTTSGRAQRCGTGWSNRMAIYLWVNLNRYISGPITNISLKLFFIVDT